MKNYSLGQFRKTNTDSYMDQILNYRMTEIKTTKEDSEAIIFIDQGLSLSKAPLEEKHNYYLHFRVHKGNRPQIISLKLKNENEVDGDIQELYTYEIEAGDYKETVPIDLLITPVNNFNQLVFELQRVSADYRMENPDGTHGRKTDIEIIYLGEMKNLLDLMNTNKILKMGIQGPSGLMMCINGEEIHIGRSGIYEMIYDVPIYFLGIVIEDPKKDDNYFIIDYQY